MTEHTDDPYGLQRMQADLNAAYRERAQLVALLAAVYPSTWGIDPDWTDWHVVYVQLPTGQASWHISPNDRDLFPHVPGPAQENWDGHTTEEKYERVARAATLLTDVGEIEALPVGSVLLERRIDGAVMAWRKERDGYWFPSTFSWARQRGALAMAGVRPTLIHMPPSVDLQEG